MMVAKVRIRLGALKHNLQVLRHKSRGSKIMAVVKANAYGHGLIPIARALRDADSLAVARLSEAIALRRGGIDMPIVVLSGCIDTEEIITAAELNVELCIHATAQIRWLEKYNGVPVDIWLKIDTGMHRLGIQPADFPRSFARLGNCSAVRSIGLMTHLANADDVGDDATTNQVALFASLVEGHKNNLSIANSAGILGWPSIGEVFADASGAGRLWARPGLSLYGLSPLLQKTGTELDLEPAMQFESQLIAVKAIKAGDKVGYGGTWHAAENTTIGVVAIGYGDGYSRCIPSTTPMLVNGRRCNVVGRISMDLCAVDLGIAATDEVGDMAIMWGRDLPAEEIANRANTIPYTLVTGITERVERVFDD